MKFKCECGTIVEVSDDKGVKTVTCPACGAIAQPATSGVKVHCSCGHVFEIAEGQSAAKARCPACGEAAAPTAGAIKFRCHCGKPLEAPKNRAGQMFVCPFCRLTMLIPLTTQVAPSKEQARRRKQSQHGGDYIDAKPVWSNKWLDSAQWPGWVRPLAVLVLLAAIVIPIWSMVSSPSRSSAPPQTANPPPANPAGNKASSASAFNPAPPVSPPPAPKVAPPAVAPPPLPPPPKVFGEDCFNVIIGVTGKHFDIEGYRPDPNDTSPAYREGAVLVVGMPEGVTLDKVRFEFRQIVLAEKKEGRVTFRAATPHDTIHLRQAMTLFGKTYAAGDFAVPRDGKVEDAGGR